jgi:atlastin
MATAAVADAKDMYVHGMEEICGGNQPYIETNELDKAHKEIRDAAIEQVKRHVTGSSNK